MATYSHLGNGFGSQAPMGSTHVPPVLRPPATAPAATGVTGLGPAGSPQSKAFSANLTSPYGSWDHLPAGSVDEDADPDFEEMVSDLRRSFVGWLKKAELETKQHRSDIRRGRQAFEEEKLSVWQQFMAEKQREAQVQGDIEEARQRISQEYGLFEADRQRLANPQLAAESTVDLNVGGALAPQPWPGPTPEAIRPTHCFHLGSTNKTK
eukprot:Skav236496  [mRNA]  locus=scaffold1440:333020:336896:+ [translate_table: standard]